MGDYKKLIVSCTIKGQIKEELNGKIAELNLYDSAYHSQERIISIEPNRYNHDDLNLIGQSKFGRGQDEFCEWLRPHVIQGSGSNEVFAMSFSGYTDEPTLFKLRNEKIDYGM